VKHELSDEAFIDSMRENCQRITDLGLDIWSTEVSVSPSWEHVRDRELSLERQAYVYRRLIEVFLEFPRYRGFTLWGINRREGMGRDGEGIGFYPFDRDLRVKPCFYAVQETFRTTTRG
jgi:GH35 family endo-1,4-beta-xylanase